MLTIQNYNKIVGLQVESWVVVHALQSDDYYYFGLSNRPNPKTAKTTVSIIRNSITTDGFYTVYKDSKNTGITLAPSRITNVDNMMNFFHTLLKY
jgi:hypothetical protein